MNMLIRLMNEIETGTGRGALVSIRSLRAHRALIGMKKTDFDGLVLLMARKGLLSLHRHDYVSSLSDGERDELVHCEDGIKHPGNGGQTGLYFVAAAIRMN